MELVSISGKTEECTQGSMNMIRSMVLGHTHGQTVVNMQDNGQIASVMEEARSYLSMEQKDKVFGNRIEESNGLMIQQEPWIQEHPKNPDYSSCFYLLNIDVYIINF